MSIDQEKTEAPEPPARDPSIRDVLAKLEEIEAKLQSIEAMIDQGVCCYGSDY